LIGLAKSKFFGILTRIVIDLIIRVNILSENMQKDSKKEETSSLILAEQLRIKGLLISKKRIFGKEAG
jgi:hypothetical protein